MKYLSLFLFVCVAFAQDLPQTFSKLATPLYTSYDNFSQCIDDKNLLQSYRQDLDDVKALGYEVDKDKQRAKEYLFRLRTLQKEYDKLSYIVHKGISKAIDDNNYKLFTKLTSYDFDGLLKSSGLYKKSLNFYKKNKKAKKIAFFEKKMHYDKLELETFEEFSNKATTDSYSSTNTQVNRSKKVRLEAVKKDAYIAIFVTNMNPYSISIKITEKLKNFKVKSFKSKDFALKAGQKVEYMRLYKKLGKFKFFYGFSYTWIIGSVDAVHDDSYIYSLPYTKGKSYVVSQGYNGKHTHKGRSKYAIDFAMPIGTKIHAVRDGLVVKLKEDSNKGGGDKSFASFGNYITIEHKDGTFATYYHLKKNGVLANIGEQVRKGERIAYSGNTGYSTGPHLHLSIFKASSATRTQTIPVKIMTRSGVVQEPVEGKSYIAE